MNKQEVIKRSGIICLFFLIYWPSLLLACDACQRNFERELREGTSNSPHAAELLRLIEKADKTESIDTSKVNSGLSLVSLSESSITQVQSSKAKTTPSRTATHPTSTGMNQTYSAGRVKRTTTLPPTSYVEPGTKADKQITITMSEGETFIGNGVVYKGFLINGQLPGPTLIVEEGDIVEFTVINEGNVPHGVSIHAAYTQTSKHLGKIQPGEQKTLLFRASYPGVYMYHCAPGGHAIPMHVLLGQYGMMVVRPKEHKYRMEEILDKKPDVEAFILQHELYKNGKDAVEGNALYTMFNGKLFRHVEEPINAKPGDFIRINFLNVGPNLLSTFHIVGIIWDFAYWQGLPHDENTFVGGQSVLAGPTDSWVIDFRAPEDEGAYLILNHAVGAATRGAIGILNVSNSSERSAQVLADGLKYSEAEMTEAKKKAVRVVSPTEPSPEELANPWKLPQGETRARITIQGNSYYPKVIEVPVGTTVEWINEDVFTYYEGEFSGVHNAVGFMGPEPFASPLLGHAEKFEHTFTKVGEYQYMCTPHPYMRGVIRVIDKR